jgi:hypothetical protein
MDAGCGDATPPFDLVIFVGDDGDWSLAPDMLAEQWATCDHRETDDDGVGAFAAAVSAAQRGCAAE